MQLPSGHLPKEWIQRGSIATSYPAVERKSISLHPSPDRLAVLPQVVHCFLLQTRLLCNRCFVVWLGGLPLALLQVRNRAGDGNSKKQLNIQSLLAMALCIDILTQEAEGSFSPFQCQL